MRCCVCIIVFLLFSSEVNAFQCASGLSSGSSLIDYKGKINSHAITIYAEDLSDQGFIEELSAPENANCINRYNSAVKSIIEKNNSSYQRAVAGSLILRTNNVMVEGALVYSSIAYSNPYTGMLALGAGFALNSLSDMADTKIKENVRSELRFKLEQLNERQRTNLQSSLSQIDPSTQQGKTLFLNAINENLDLVISDPLNDLENESQEVVNEYYVKLLVGSVQEGFKEILDGQSLNRQDIKTNRENIAEVQQQFSEYAEATNQRIRNIETNQLSLINNVQALNQNVAKNVQNIGAMQSYLLNGMSTSEKIKYLEAGWAPSLSGHEREAYLSELNSLKDQEELEKQIGGYLEDAQRLVNISYNLGFDNDFTQDLSAAIGVAGTVFTAYMQWGTNPLSSIEAISSLFGGSRVDPAAKRHKQIMNAFRALNQRLTVMDAKLDSLLVRQQRIMKNQAKIFEAIVSVSEQIQANQEQLIGSLNDIQRTILDGTSILVNYNRLGISTCEDLLYNYSSQGERIIDIETGLIPSYSFLKTNEGYFRDPFLSCKEATVKFYSDGDFNGSYFWLKSYITTRNSGKVTAYIDSVHLPIYDLMRHSDFFPPSLRSVNNSILSHQLSIPSATVENLNHKIENPITNDEFRYNSSAFKDFGELMHEKLHVDAVTQYVEMLIDIHVYEVLFNNDGELIDYETLLQGNQNSPVSALTKLQKARHLIDVAIAQQNLLAGEILLPVIDNLMASDSVELNKEAGLAFQNNEILRKNYLMFKMRNQVQINGNYLSYQEAYHSSNVYKIKSITDETWDFFRKADKWYVRLFSNDVEIPTADMLYEGRLMHYPDLYRLLDVRAQLINEINTYSVLNDTSLAKGIRQDFIEASLIYNSK